MDWKRPSYGEEQEGLELGRGRFRQDLGLVKEGSKRHWWEVWGVTTLNREGCGCCRVGGESGIPAFGDRDSEGQGRAEILKAGRDNFTCAWRQP